MTVYEIPYKMPGMHDMAIIPAPEVLAFNVQREMNARGWNQMKLAEACGLPQPRISEVLSGKFDHRLKTVEKIADAFGITVSALLMPPAELLEPKNSARTA